MIGLISLKIGSLSIVDVSIECPYYFLIFNSFNFGSNGSNATKKVYFLSAN